MAYPGVFEANKPKNKAVARAVASLGGAHATAQQLNVSSTAVLHWIYRRCPAERCVDLEKLTGVPRSTMRPDIFE